VRGGGAGRAALRADDAAHGDRERPVRPGRAAAGAVDEARRPAGDGEGAEQERVEDEPGVVPPLGEGPQTAGEEQEKLDGRLALGVGEPLGGLEHRRPRGVPAVVRRDRRAVRADRLDLGDDVERAALVELDVDEHERLDPGAEPGRRLPDALRDGPDQPAPPGQERDDPVGLAELLAAQDDGLSR